MKDTKYFFSPISEFNLEKLEKKLEKKAAEGWLICDTTPLGFIAKRTEPKKLKFKVILFPKVSYFDTDQDEKTAELREFCQENGWKFAAAENELLIFYNENPEALDITTDPVTDLSNIDKVYSRKMAFVSTVFIVIPCVFLSLEVLYLCLHLQKWVNSIFGPVATAIFVIMLVMSIFMNVGFKKWRDKAKLTAISENRLLPSPDWLKYEMLLLITECTGIFFYLGQLLPKGSTLLTVGTIIFSVLATLYFTEVTTCLRKAGISKTKNIILGIVLPAIVFAAIIAIGLILYLKYVIYA